MASREPVDVVDGDRNVVSRAQHHPHDAAKAPGLGKGLSTGRHLRGAEVNRRQEAHTPFGQRRLRVRRAEEQREAFGSGPFNPAPMDVRR